MNFLRILLLSIAASVMYGILHDLVTAHVCVEYFTIGHPPVFHTHSPILLAIGWGTIASWWMGAFLGAFLGLAAIYGPYPVFTVQQLVRPIGILLMSMGLCALCSGTFGYIAARNDWIDALDYGGIFSPDKAWRFTADAWAHSASYFTGALGGLGLCFWVILQRRRIHSHDKPGVNPLTS